MAKLLHPRSIKFSDDDLELVCRASRLTGETFSDFVRRMAVSGANRRINPAAPERLTPITEMLAANYKMALMLERLIR